MLIVFVLFFDEMYGCRRQKFIQGMKMMENGSCEKPSERSYLMMTFLMVYWNRKQQESWEKQQFLCSILRAAHQKLKQSIFCDTTSAWYIESTNLFYFTILFVN